MTIAQGVPHRRPYDYARLLSSFPAASSTKTENGAPEEWDAAVYVRNIPPHGHRTKAKFRRYLWKNCGLRDFWVTEVNVKNRQQDGRLAMVVNFPSSEEALLAKYRITCIPFKGSTLRTSFMNRRTGSTAEESRQESDIALADTDATPSPILPAVPRRTPKRDSLSERDSGSSMPKHELYVGHLAGTTTLEQLQRLFQYAPGFKSVRLVEAAAAFLPEVLEGGAAAAGAATEAGAAAGGGGLVSGLLDSVETIGGDLVTEAESGAKSVFDDVESLFGSGPSINSGKPASKPPKGQGTTAAKPPKGSGPPAGGVPPNSKPVGSVSGNTKPVGSVPQPPTNGAGTAGKDAQSSR
ncbi:hypothetical protein FRB99_008582 [Tulasnella sp. 403]|nr:hypothetical protein FRB99_008582 [Tulasnella sp. 403]